MDQRGHRDPIGEAEQLARGLPRWRDAELHLQPLSGGITNRNYVVASGGERHVIRLPGERTELLGITRAHEAEAARRAASLGLGPPVLGELPGVGTLVTQWVQGEHLSDEAFLRRLPEVVALLRRFHGGGPLAGSFPIHRVVERHARDATAHGVPAPDIYQHLQRLSARIEAAFAAAAAPVVPCHNDLLPANLLFGSDRVWLLDYEYAGMNELFFDLANLSVNARLQPVHDEQLLRLYFGRSGRSAWARLQLMKVMSEFREGMWAVVQQAISRLDTDFAGYARQRLASAERLAGAPEFGHWLEQAREAPC